MRLHIPLNGELVSINVTKKKLDDARYGGIEILIQVVIEHIVAWEFAKRQSIPLPDKLYGQKPEAILKKLEKTAKNLAGKQYDDRIAAAKRRLSDYVSLRLALYHMDIYTVEQLLEPPGPKKI